MWNPQDTALTSQLSPGEKLSWSGQPSKGLIFRANDIFMIPFSLMWGGFAITWEFTVISSGAPFFFMLWGIPFVLIGVHMIAGRFFADAWQRSKTHYGVTNERIIIASGIFNKQVKSLNLKTLSDITLNEKSDGSGTIIFGSDNLNSKLAGFPLVMRGTQPAFPSFELIPNARNVYDIIRRAQNSAK